MVAKRKFTHDIDHTIRVKLKKCKDASAYQKADQTGLL